MGFTKTFFSPALIDQSPWDDVSALNVDDPDVVAKPNLPDHYAFPSVHHAWAKSRGAFPALRRFQSPFSQDSGTMQALELGGGLAAGRNPVRTKTIDGLQALDGVGGDDEDVQRILDEWVNGQLRGRKAIYRNDFSETISQFDFSELMRLIPAGVKRPIQLVLDSFWGPHVYVSLRFETESSYVKPRHQSASLLITDNGVTVTKVEGMNADDTLKGFFANRSVSVVQDLSKKMFAIWLESQVFLSRNREGGGYSKMTRDQLIEIFQKTNFKDILLKSEILKPGFLESSCQLTLTTIWEGDEIRSGRIVTGDDLNCEIAKQEQRITFDIKDGEINIVAVEGTNAHQTIIALSKNLQVNFSENMKLLVICAHLQEKISENLEKSGKGFKPISKERWLQLLETDFNVAIAALRKERPQLFTHPAQIVLSSYSLGATIKGVNFKPKDETNKTEMGYQYIFFEVTQTDIYLTEVAGINQDHSLDALFSNASIGIAQGLQERATQAWLQARIFQDIPEGEHGKGYGKIGRGIFLQLLREKNFRKTADEARRLRPSFFNSPIRLVIFSRWVGDVVSSLSLELYNPKKSESSSRQQIHLLITERDVAVYHLDGFVPNKRSLFASLAANSHLSIHPFLLAQQGVSRAEEMLLLRLSEFGRTLLHNEIRRLEISRGIAVNNQTRAVDTEIVHEAAFNVLVNFGRQFVSDRDAGSAWQPNDRRFAVAQTLGRFVTVPMPREDAEAVSALLMTALLHERERTLGEYFRVIRLVGDSPIAESGWDAIFSPGLRKALRKFAAGWFAIGDVANPAADYLRDPFNEVVGAYYYHLLQGGNHADQRFEILAHVFYQQRRGDNLKPFYDGMIKASGLGEDSVHAAIKRELRAYAAQRDEWELDDEEPTRLVDGLVGGAARFVWNGTLNTSQRQMMVQMARDIFPQHVLDFPDDTNLAEILPQALFFEVLGRAAHTLADHWIANASDRNFENSIALLNMLTGLGDESAWGFRRGFGNDISARTIMQAVTDYLMQHHDEAFRNWLEDVIEYSVNQIGDGTYTTKTVQIRRADLLARLMTGYSLRNHALVLQRFRLNNLTERQELEKAQGIWQKIQDGTSDTADRQWLYQVLNRWTAPKTGARIGGATVGERWYLIEQWVTQNGADPSGKFLDALLAGITIL